MEGLQPATQFKASSSLAAGPAGCRRCCWLPLSLPQWLLQWHSCCVALTFLLHNLKCSCLNWIGLPRWLLLLQGRIDLKAPHNRFWLIVARSSGLGLPLLPERWVGWGRQAGTRG